MGEPRRPIDDYGIIGDTRTAALVSSDGAIDWMCVPQFDGSPLFGRLVGGRAGGTFRVAPVSSVVPTARRYRPGTAVLETTWRVGDSRVTLTEGMVAEPAGRLLPTTLLVRRLTVEGHPVEVAVEFDPRHGDSRTAPTSEHRHAGGLVCTWDSLAVALDTSPPIRVEPGRVTSTTVAPDRPLTLVLSVAFREPLVFVPPPVAWDALDADARAWARWSSAIDPDLPFRDAVVRSLITLRLLTFSPSGAPVAAPTTSLPEHLGGSRNWDYRYAWPRDASIGVGAFLGVGMHHEALAFLAWLRHASRLDRPRLPVLLTLHGKHPRGERVLDGWPGYAESSPVRVGNGAADQHQLDGYGWVLDAGWLLTRAGHRLDSETWRAMSGFADQVAEHWREPDAGIWEVRGDPQHHVHSKLMAWLALDRALRIAATRRVPIRRRRRWQEQRAAIGAELASRGWSAELSSYTRTYGSADLDAAALVLPLVGIESADSARVRGTIDAVARALSAGGPLLFRYPPGDDGLDGTEGAFLPCAFWLVQALATTGRVAEATDRLAALVERGSPLGLYAEEMDPSTGEHLGNFPQALTHSALVQAALALRDGGRSTGGACDPFSDSGDRAPDGRSRSAWSAASP
jgi:GH15 family glucan-1,4-alpha-glucosidase